MHTRVALDLPYAASKVCNCCWSYDMHVGESAALLFALPNRAKFELRAQNLLVIRWRRKLKMRAGKAMRSTNRLRSIGTTKGRKLYSFKKEEMAQRCRCAYEKFPGDAGNHVFSNFADPTARG